MKGPPQPVNRSFIAYVLPPEARNLCASVQASLKKDGVKGKFVVPDNCHVTLHFLGYLPLQELIAIHDAVIPLGDKLDEILFRPLRLDSFGRPPRVLFIDLDDVGGKGCALAEELIITADLTPEKGRDWKAHLTIARFRSGSEARTWRGTTELAGTPACFRPEGIGFFTSASDRIGPVYTLERFIARPSNTNTYTHSNNL